MKKLMILTILLAIAAPGLCEDWNTAVQTMPFKTVAEATAMYDKILVDAPASVEAICGGLVDPCGTDRGERIALQGLCLYVKTSKGEAARATVAGAIVKSLEAQPKVELTCFLLRRLREVGADSEVAVLAKYAKDHATTDAACRALVSIGTPKAKAALRGAYGPEIKQSARTSIAQAIGDVRDVEGAKMLLPLLGKVKNPILDQTICYAASACGLVEILPALKEMRTQPTRVVRYRATGYQAMLVRALGKAGNKAKAIEVATELMSWAEENKRTGVICVAMNAAIDGCGKDARGLIARALGSTYNSVRLAALKRMAKCPLADGTKNLTDLLAPKAPLTTAEVAWTIGYRGDAKALPALKAALAKASAGDKKIIVTSIAQLGDAEYLFANLTNSDAAIAAVCKARVEFLPVPVLEAKLSGLLKTLTGDAKSALMDLAARRGIGGMIKELMPKVLEGDREAIKQLAVAAGERDITMLVIEASKNPEMANTLLKLSIAAAKKTSSAAAKDMLCAAMVQTAIKGNNAYAALVLKNLPKAAAVNVSKVDSRDAVTYVKSKLADAELGELATRALLDWPEYHAIAELSKMAVKAKDETSKLLALRAWIRIADECAGLHEKKKLEELGKAGKLVTRVDEKRLVIGALGRLVYTGSLPMLQAYLKDADVMEDAATAIVNLAPQCKRDGAEAKAALTDVIAVTKDEAVKAKAQAALKGAKPGKKPSKKPGKKPAKKKVVNKTSKASVKTSEVNVALGKTVTTNGRFESTNDGTKATDGNTGSYWAASPGETSIVVDLAKDYPVETIRTVWYQGDGRYYQCTVELSADAKAWTMVVDASKNTAPSTAAGYVTKIKPVSARYVRVDALKNSANPSKHLCELEVYPTGKAPTLQVTQAAGKTLAKKAKKKPVKKPAKKPSNRPSIPAATNSVYPSPLGYPDKDGFVALFNGKDLTGWVGKGYQVEEGGILHGIKNKVGYLRTTHKFADFHLKFDFKLTPGANNGLGIRYPGTGNAAHNAMELQILDFRHERYMKDGKSKLQPYQNHGGIYTLVAPKMDALEKALKPANEWNHQEVIADGYTIKIILNGIVIQDADLLALSKTDPHFKGKTGWKNTEGYIAFLGHRDELFFRNIAIKPLLPNYENDSKNVAPEGFTALFNGKDLTGWHGGPNTKDPVEFASLPAEEKAAEQAKMDATIAKHWKVDPKDNSIVSDGSPRANYLTTKKAYGNFEFTVDYKTVAKADSGVYLRGTPQVQIWDTTEAAGKWRLGANFGSAGLWNNKKNPRMAMIHADKPFGQWNRLRIKLVGDKCTVWLNGQKTVDNVVYEKFYKSASALPAKAPIQLQTHGGEIRWRNLFIKELP